MVRLSRLGKTAKHVTIASGEMKPVGGIMERVRMARLLVDKRSVGNVGKGMPSK